MKLLRTAVPLGAAEADSHSRIVTVSEQVFKSGHASFIYKRWYGCVWRGERHSGKSWFWLYAFGLESEIDSSSKAAGVKAYL